jgi:hypothetical protein
MYPGNSSQKTKKERKFFRVSDSSDKSHAQHEQQDASVQSWQGTSGFHSGNVLSIALNTESHQGPNGSQPWAGWSLQMNGGEEEDDKKEPDGGKD